MDVQKITDALREFADRRDWQKFHSPKNLASALTVEAAELLEIFQWMKEDESRSPDDETKRKAAREIADIQIYLIRLADVMGVDIGSEVEMKIGENDRKYPVDKAKGNATKYDRL